ncbi:MAG: type II toxin-antitoxin system Phd/YefM family antitoxin [Acidimicrobiia bacterium]
MDRVGIRELRRNLTVYLRRVLAGETLEVTDRGQPVAILAPLSPTADILARHIRAGRVRPGPRAGERFEPPVGEETTAGTDALAAQRAER